MIKNMKSFTPDEPVDDHACENCQGSGVAAVRVEGMTGIPTPDDDLLMMQVFFAAKNKEEIRDSQSVFIHGKTESKFIVAPNVPWQSSSPIIQAMVSLGHSPNAKEVIGEPEYVVLFDGDYTRIPGKDYDIPDLGPDEKIDASVFFISRERLWHSFFFWEGRGKAQYVASSDVTPEDGEIYEAMKEVQDDLINGGIPAE